MGNFLNFLNFFSKKNTREESKQKEDNALTVTIFEEGEYLNVDICGRKPEVINYDDEDYKLCYEKNKWKSVKANEKELYHLLAIAAVCDSERKNFYYISEESIISLSKADENVITIKKEALEQTEEQSIQDAAVDAAEVIFNGASVWRIKESQEEMKKKVKKSNRLKTFAMIAILLAALFYQFEEFLSEPPEILRTPPEKPKPNPLNENEKRILKRGASIEMIDAYVGEIDKFLKEKKLKEKQRIIGFALTQVSNIPAVEPRLVENREWVYPPGPRRGAVSYVVNKIYQQIFPSVGYSKQGEEVYSRSENETFYLDEKYLVNNKEDFEGIVLTESCMKEILKLDESVEPIQRSTEEIEIFIRKVKPSLVSKKVKNIIRKCPIYIGELRQEGELFMVKMEIFKKAKQ